MQDKPGEYYRTIAIANHAKLTLLRNNPNIPEHVNVALGMTYDSLWRRNILLTLPQQGSQQTCIYSSTKAIFNIYSWREI